MVNQYWQRVRQKLNRDALLTLTGRIVGMGLQFATVIVIARTLGAAGVGVYSLYSAVLVLVSAFIGIGAPTHSFRRIAQYHSEHQHAQVRQFTRGIMGVITLIGLAALLLAWVTVQMGWLDATPALRDILLYSVAGSVAFALLRILFEGMQGVGKLATAMFVENNLAPLVMMLACGVLAWHFDQVEPYYLIAVNMASFGWLAAVMYRELTRDAKNSPTPAIKVPVLDRSMVAIWISTILDMAFINLPTIMAAKFDTLEEVGKFSIAFRFMGVAVSLLMIIRGIAGRQLIVAYKEGDLRQCRDIAHRMMRYGLLMYLPMIAVFIFFGNEVLAIFGKSFNGGEKYLWVLSIGQLIYALFGMMGFVLIIMDNGKVEALVAVASMGLMVGLAWAGSEHGVMAVAVAYAIGISIRSLVSYGLVRQRFRGVASMQPTEKENT